MDVLSRVVNGLLVIIVLAAVGVSLVYMGPSDGELEKVLNLGGLTEVHFIGWSLTECNTTDVWQRDFVAVSADNHQPISGTICKGVFSRATVRIK